MANKAAGWQWHHFTWILDIKGDALISCKRVKVTQNSIHYIDKSVPGKSESSATNQTTTQQPVLRAYYIIPLFSGRCFHDSILHNAIGTHPARCHQSPITERPLYSQSRFFNSLILFRLSRHITSQYIPPLPRASPISIPDSIKKFRIWPSFPPQSLHQVD